MLADGIFGIDTPDDVCGIIRASALPFSEDPEDPDTYERWCTDCPREYYGSGILDIGRAAELVEYLAEGQVRTTVSKYAGHVPGTWEYDLVDCSTYHGVLYLQYRVSATVTVAGGISPRDRPRPAWVCLLDEDTNTFCSHGQWAAERALLAWQHEVKGCRLSLVDWDNEATIHGYDYAFVDAEGGIHFKLGEEQVRMTFATVLEPVVEVPEVSFDGTYELPYICPMANPSFGCIRIRYYVPYDTPTEVTVYDIAGRVIMRQKEEKRTAGWHSTTRGMTDAEAPVPSGVYWALLDTGRHRSKTRLVLLH